MRILIVSTFFPPLNSIASLRPYSWAKYWTLAGHDVTVLTTKKYPKGNQELHLENPGFKIIEAPLPNFIVWLTKKYVSQNHQGKIKINQAKDSYLPTFRSWLSKIFDKLRSRTGVLNASRFPDITHLWIKRALKATGDKEWNLIISSSGPYPVHLVAFHLKQKNPSTLWAADFRDLWIDSYMYPGIWPFTILENYYEKQIANSADALITVSEPQAKTLGRKYINKPVKVIYNGFDPCDLAQISKNPFFPTKNKFRIVYTGSIYENKQDPTPLFKAIKEISQDSNNAPFLKQLEVIFYGPSSFYLNNLIHKYNVVKWVSYKGALSRNEALQAQRDANALLFLSWTDTTQEGCITGKIFEYLFSKTFILCVGRAIEDEAAKLILSTNTGLFLGDDVKKIKEFLLNKLKDRSYSKKNGYGVDKFNTYTREFQATQLLAYLQDIQKKI